MPSSDRNDPRRLTGWVPIRYRNNFADPGLDCVAILTVRREKEASGLPWKPVFD
jgi:hypothetical protein